MRVAHVMSPGPLAGAENVVLDGCAALVREGHDVALHVMVEERCPEYGERLLAVARDRDIPSNEIRVRGRFDVRAIANLRRVVEESRVEVVHAHGYKALVYAFLSPARRASLVVTHHGETGHDRLAKAYERLARWVYRRVDAVFAVSSATADALIDAGVPGEKLRTIPNPVALPPVETQDAKDVAELQLLFVGRLSPEKGLDVLLRALASPEAPTTLRLDVAGDGPCRAAWATLASDLGLDVRVRWLGMRNDVPALLSRSHLLVLPSRREGLPLVILEATSSGVPVLASRVGGIPEAVWEGENAVLVQAEDPRAWVAALAELPSRVGALRAGALRRAPEVRSRHAPTRWAEMTAACYAEVTGTSQEARAG